MRVSASITRSPVLPAIAMVQAGGNRGSGVVIRRGSSAYVLTAAHVVGDNSTVTITANGKASQGTVAALDTELDVAVISGEIHAPGYSPERLTRATAGRVSMMPGFESGTQFREIKGNISSINSFVAVQKHLSGMSGSPVFSDAGIVGIHTGDHEASLTSYFAPGDVCLQFLLRHRDRLPGLFPESAGPIDTPGTSLPPAIDYDALSALVADRLRKDAEFRSAITGPAGPQGPRGVDGKPGRDGSAGDVAGLSSAIEDNRRLISQILDDYYGADGKPRKMQFRVLGADGKPEQTSEGKPNVELFGIDDPLDVKKRGVKVN